MKHLTAEVIDAVNKLRGKGSCIIKVGPTGSGKSTLDGSLTDDEVVQDLLQTREADGKGSLVAANIMITNHPDIPREGIIVDADVKKMGMAEVNDDGELLGDILYVATSEYKKNPSKELFCSKIEKVFDKCLLESANDSLAYKLKYVSIEDIVKIKKHIQSVNISSIMATYEETVACTPKKAMATRKIFVDTLKNNPELCEFIRDFWKLIIDAINRDEEKLIQLLDDAGAEVTTDENKNNHFSILFGKEDIGTDVLNILLKSEDKSKEYFISDLSIIFRGNDEIFKNANVDTLKVAELNGKDVYCLHMVDTQGLFHSSGVKPREEYERIVDLLSAYHSNTMILTINSDVDNTVKDSYEAIKLLLAEATRSIDIYILYTYWDGYMKKMSQNANGSRGRFGFDDRTAIDWDSVYEKAVQKQEELTESFRNTISQNNAKNKPVIKGTFRAALLTDNSSEMEKKLFDEFVFYPLAMSNLIGSILKQEALVGPKYRVTDAVNICSFNADGMRQSVKALYRGMVVDCKNLRLYASTVRACVRKWTKSGSEHKSDIAENAYGFKNIRTAFVQEIRNLGVPMLGKIVIDTSCVLDSDKSEAFKTALETYFKDNLGREIAMAIGEKSYKGGFESGDLGLYQYEYFNNMITYTQNHFFRGEQLVFGADTKELSDTIRGAIDKCLKHFIDSRCIEVY